MATECTALDACTTVKASRSFTPQNVAASVDWPAITRINPDVTDYTFTVTDAGGGYLMAAWTTHRQPVERAVLHTMDFGVYDGSGHVAILRCSSPAGSFCVFGGEPGGSRGASQPRTLRHAVVP